MKTSNVLLFDHIKVFIKLLLRNSDINLILIKILSPALLVWLATKGGNELTLIHVLLIVYISSSPFFEFVVNIFGFDGPGVYIRQFTNMSFFRHLIITQMLFLLLGSFIALSYYFLITVLGKISTGYQYLYLLLTFSILIFNFFWGIYASIHYPKKIPKGFKAKMYQVNPGIGLIVWLVTIILLAALIVLTYFQNSQNLDSWFKLGCLVVVICGVLAGLFFLFNIRRWISTRQFSIINAISTD